MKTKKRSKLPNLRFRRQNYPLFKKKIKLGHSKQNNKYLHKLEVTRLTQVTF